MKIRTFIRIFPTLFTLSGFFFSLAVQADWEGKFTLTHPPLKGSGKTSSPLKGTVRVKGSRSRIDWAGFSTINDFQKKTGWLLFHPTRQVLPSDFSQIRNLIPLCDPMKVRECLEKNGFHVTGKATIADLPCTIYEGKTSKNQIKLWKPDAHKDVIALRAQVTDSAGAMTLIEITQFKPSTQKEDAFVLPRGYTELKLKK